MAITQASSLTTYPQTSAPATPAPVESRGDRAQSFGWLPKVSMVDALEFYPQMRFFMYFFETEYSHLSRLLAKLPAAVRLAEKTSFKSFSQMADERQPWDGGVPREVLNAGQHFANMLEAFTFLTLSTIHFIVDRGKVMRTLSAPVGAELGLPPEKVGLLALWRSKNPLVRTEMQKLALETATRVGTDAMFFQSLKGGIIAKSVDIVLEYTAFRKETSIDLMAKMVERAQHNVVSPIRARDQLIDDFVLVIQNSRQKEHRSALFSEADLKPLEPVFHQMAQGVVDNKIGLGEIIYLLGRITRDPEHARQHALTVETVLTKGMRAVPPTHPADEKAHFAQPHTAAVSRSKQLPTNGAGRIDM